MSHNLRFYIDAVEAAMKNPIHLQEEPIGNSNDERGMIVEVLEEHRDGTVAAKNIGGIEEDPQGEQQESEKEEVKVLNGEEDVPDDSKMYRKQHQIPE